MALLGTVGLVSGWNFGFLVDGVFVIDVEYSYCRALERGKPCSGPGWQRCSAFQCGGHFGCVSYLNSGRNHVLILGLKEDMLNERNCSYYANVTLR